MYLCCSCHTEKGQVQARPTNTSVAAVGAHSTIRAGKSSWGSRRELKGAGSESHTAQSSRRQRRRRPNVERKHITKAPASDFCARGFCVSLEDDLCESPSHSASGWGGPSAGTRLRSLVMVLICNYKTPAMRAFACLFSSPLKIQCSWGSWAPMPHSTAQLTLEACIFQQSFPGKGSPIMHELRWERAPTATCTRRRQYCQASGVLWGAVETWSYTQCWNCTNFQFFELHAGASPHALQATKLSGYKIVTP